MSAAAAPVTDGAPVPAKKGKKKLIIIALAVLLVLAIAGGAAVFLMKKKAAGAAEAEGDETSTSAAAGAHGSKPDLKHPPTFLPHARSNRTMSVECSIMTLFAPAGQDRFRLQAHLRCHSLQSIRAAAR